MNLIRLKERKLFWSWRRRYPGQLDEGTSFTLDGAFNTRRFGEAGPRVVCVLMEPSTSTPDLRTGLCDGHCNTDVWRRVAQWACGVAQLELQLEFERDVRPQCKSPKGREDALARVAALNVKKTTASREGGAANSAEIARHVENDADLIDGQLRIYRPHLVVFCGKAGGGDDEWMANSFQQKTDPYAEWSKTKNDVGYYTSSSGYDVIASYHPRHRWTDADHFDRVVTAAREIWAFSK